VVLVGGRNSGSLAGLLEPIRSRDGTPPERESPESRSKTPSNAAGADGCQDTCCPAKDGREAKVSAMVAKRAASLRRELSLLRHAFVEFEVSGVVSCVQPLMRQALPAVHPASWNRWKWSL
jgi:hypothetical protein